MKNHLIAFCVAVGLLVVSIPTLAHHGTGASYDLSKLVTVKGVITRFAWSNPHSQLYFDATDDKGNVQHWSAEMNAPGNLERAGYTRKGMLDMMKVGTEVTVSGFQSKAGTPVMVFSKAVLADGREFKTANGPGALEEGK
jgi:uncharacterized protein DUF6152